jgi:hypothetical protein
MANKTMIVTIGTSLYHSASWRDNDTPLAGIKGYSRWVEDYLNQPGKRPTMVAGDCGSETGDSIMASIENELKRDNAKEWSNYFAVDDKNPLRYSAEITTIIKLYEIERGSASDLSSFLGNKYKRVILLTDENESDKGHIAAYHIKEYLMRLAPSLQSLFVIDPRISGSNLSEKVASLRTYLEQFDKKKDVDLVLSGGFKIYAMMSALLIQGSEWRIVYIHESGNNLVTLDDCDVETDGEGKVTHVKPGGTV